ncbi:MAG: hypothetical protein KBT01_06190 [Clostridiales bacterium]|nr:hypothetical protein [Candidatus Blautia equi]
MNKKKLLAILALTLSFTMGLTACGKKEEDVIVDETEERVELPEEETGEGIKDAVYTSADEKIAIKLPDATWAVKVDQEDLYSFYSEAEGSIMIEHGAGEEALSSRIIPNTQDLAETLESGEAGTDYQIQNYSAEDNNGNSTYAYIVKNLKKDGEFANKIVKVFANSGEYYALTGTILNDDNTDLASIRNSLDSFQILDPASTLKEFSAPAEEPVEEKPAEEEKPAVEPMEEAPAETPAVEAVEEEPAAEEPAPEAPAPAAGGIAPSKDNPDNSDNTKTRTIYTNDGTGRAIVVTLNADGVWVDIDGNQYRFQNESDCYDQNDVDYYYHGEAADVYFMPIG